jgi:hypothetical protein
VTDADVDAKIKDDATTPELRHAWMIAVAPALKQGESVATPDEKAAAKAKADQALADLKAGKDWDEIILEKRGLRFWLHFAVRPENSKQKNRRKVSMQYVTI